MSTSNSKSLSLCEDQPCRIEMLHQMFDAIKGTNLLLEAVQPDKLLEIYNKKFNPERKKYAFKTLIATMLSVRSKDETIIKVINKLWEKYSTPQEIAEAPLEDLEILIHSSGTYHQKAVRIKETSRIIHEKYSDQVPDTLEDLLKFPGVGRKVANCVLVLSFDKPAIPVDTHVHRISNRIGWCTTKTPEKTESALMKLFPKSEWKVINYTLVSFGKNICKPIKPLCSDCPINAKCLKRIIFPKKRSKLKKQK